MADVIRKTNAAAEETMEAPKIRDFSESEVRYDKSLYRLEGGGEAIKARDVK